MMKFFQTEWNADFLTSLPTFRFIPVADFIKLIKFPQIRVNSKYIFHHLFLYNFFMF